MTCGVLCYSTPLRCRLDDHFPQVAEEDLVSRIPLRVFTPVICYDVSAVKNTILKGLRQSRKGLLDHVTNSLQLKCSKILNDTHSKLRWLAQVPNTPHELHSRQEFCDSADAVLQHHQGFVLSANVYMALLQQFDWPLDDSTSSVFYESILLPKTITQCIQQQQPLLQQLLQKFVAEHQQQLAGYISDLQQTELDVRQFHSYRDIERTESCDDLIIPVFISKKRFYFVFLDTPIRSGRCRVGWKTLLL